MTTFNVSGEILKDLLTSCTRLMDTVNGLLARIPPQADKPAAAEPPSESSVSVPTPEGTTPPAELTKETLFQLLTKKSAEEGGKFRPRVKAIVQKYSEGGTFSQIPLNRYPDIRKELEALQDE